MHSTLSYNAFSFRPPPTPPFLPRLRCPPGSNLLLPCYLPPPSYPFRTKNLPHPLKTPSSPWLSSAVSYKARADSISPDHGSTVVKSQNRRPLTSNTLDPGWKRSLILSIRPLRRVAVEAIQVMPPSSPPVQTSLFLPSFFPHPFFSTILLGLMGVGAHLGAASAPVLICTRVPSSKERGRVSFTWLLGSRLWAVDDFTIPESFLGDFFKAPRLFSVPWCNVSIEIGLLGALSLGVFAKQASK